jgi:hypothetical protein
MYPQTHALASLFKHLGLAHDEVAIARFIEQHSPLQERGKNAARTRQTRRGALLGQRPGSLFTRRDWCRC